MGSVKSLLKRLSTAVSGLSIHCIVAFDLDSAAEALQFSHRAHSGSILSLPCRIGTYFQTGVPGFEGKGGRPP